MKLFIAGLAFALIAVAAPDQSASQQDRVRAAEPTVVDVVSSRPSVETKKSDTKRRSLPARTWNRVIDFFGWSLNSSDDIPSTRERRSSTAEQSSGQTTSPVR